MEGKEFCIGKEKTCGWIDQGNDGKVCIWLVDDNVKMDRGEWKSTVFKPYNFKTLGLPVGGGHLHPLMKVRTEFRRVLMDMGYDLVG